MKRCKTTATKIVTTFLCGLIMSTSASADKPTRLEMHGNKECLLMFDMSTHANPSAMFEYIRENSADFVGEADQNIAQWLSNFPEYRGNVGSLIKRNCKSFTVEIG